MSNGDFAQIYTDVLLEAPSVIWEFMDPTKYYTVMIEDNDINDVGVPRFFHWLYMNVQVN